MYHYISSVFQSLVLALCLIFHLAHCSDSCQLDAESYVLNLKDINIAVFLDVHQAHAGGCGQINPSAVQELEAVSFVFDRLNDVGYIPGVKLGFVAYDTCSGSHLAAESLRHLTSKVDNRYVSQGCSNISDFIFGIAGPSTSSEAIAMSRVLMAERPSDRLLQISHSATATTVTSSGDFSNAFSVIPPDNIQAKVIIDMLKQLSWNYVALMFTDDTYGKNGAEEIQRLANSSGICMPFVEELSVTKDVRQIQLALQRILRYGLKSRSATNGVVFFGTADIAYEVLNQAKTYDSGKLQFIFSDSVQFRSDVFRDQSRAVSGALVVEPKFRHVSSLTAHLEKAFTNKTFLLERSSANRWLQELYRNQTKCSPGTAFQDCPAITDPASLATHSLYTYYMLQVAFVYAYLMKEVYQDTCTKVPCPALDTLSREVIRNKLSTMRLNFKTEFGSAVPFEMEDGAIVFHINGTRVPAKQNQPLYEIKNLQINTCPGAAEYCLVKIGSYNGVNLSMDLTAIKSYTSSGKETPRVQAQCPVGEVCEACVRYDAAMHWVYTPGDLIVVASAPIFDPGSTPFTCGGIRLEKGMQLAEAILFAVKKINERNGIFGDVFPGKTIGTVIMNTCYSDTVTLQKMLSVFFDGDSYLVPKVTNIPPRVIGFVGSVSSDVSEQVAQILTKKNVAQVAYGSTSATLSDRKTYPYFSRTCASDKQQAEIMILLLKEMGWMYISVIHTDDSYGRNGFEVVRTTAQREGICIAQSIKVGQNPQYYTVLDQLRQTSSARIVILFLRSSNSKQLLEDFSKKNEYKAGEFIFILTESVGNRASVIADAPAAVGSFSLLQEIPDNKEFDQYFSTRATLPDLPEKVWLDAYLEPYLGCYRSNSFNKSSGKACDPTASLTGGNYFQDPWTPFAINAVYSLVLGADQAARSLCSRPGELCQAYRDNPTATQQQILKTRLDLFGTGQRISAFDSNGDGTVSFRIFNIQTDISQKPKYVKVGMWTKQEGLILDETNMVFPNEMGVPTSKCPNTKECELCKMVCSMKETCTSVDTTIEDKPLAFPLVASILAVAFVVVLVILLIACWRLRKRPEDKHLYEPDIHVPPPPVPDTDYLHAMDLYCTVSESYTPRPTHTNTSGQGRGLGEDNAGMQESNVDERELPPSCNGASPSTSSNAQI